MSPRRDDKPELWTGVLVFMVVMAIVGLLCVDDYEDSAPQRRPGYTEVER